MYSFLLYFIYVETNRNIMKYLEKLFDKKIFFEILVW